MVFVAPPMVYVRCPHRSWVAYKINGFLVFDLVVWCHTYTGYADPHNGCVTIILALDEIPDYQTDIFNRISKGAHNVGKGGIWRNFFFQLSTFVFLYYDLLLVFSF